MRSAFIFGALAFSLSLWSETTYAAPPSYLFATPQASYNVTSSGFTVECWVKPRAKTGFDPRIIRASTASLGNTDPASPDVWQLFIGNHSCCLGQVIFDITQAGTPHERFSGIRIDDGSYHHIAGTYDGTNMMRLFVDGVRTDSMAIGAITATISSGSLVVGNANAINNAFDGQIDELRIWQVGRSESQIQGSMNTELSSAPGLVASWHLNGNGVDAVASNSLTQIGDVTFPLGELNQAADISNPLPPSPPGVSAPASANGVEGNLLLFTVTASDPDGDPIASLTAAPLPMGATFTANGTNTSGTFSWTPGTGQAGSYSVTFTASNSLSGSATTAITIRSSTPPSPDAPGVSPALLVALIACLGLAGAWQLRNRA